MKDLDNGSVENNTSWRREDRRERNKSYGWTIFCHWKTYPFKQLNKNMSRFDLQKNNSTGYFIGFIEK